MTDPTNIIVGPEPSGTTLGPDIFAYDLTLPDPQTILNEPMPRAWSQGGFIESVKNAVVTGVRNAFRGSSMSNAPDEDAKFYIDIEYPTDTTKYPGIWVQFSIESLQRTGLGMEKWTKDDDNNWGPIKTWSFNGRITLTIAALTSKDRDRLADSVIAQLAFARAPDLMIRNKLTDSKQMRGLLAILDENPYVSMTLNTDQISSGGQSVTSGVPWAQNVLLYEDNYSVTCTGQFNIRFAYDGVYELAAIHAVPTIGADNQGTIPPPGGTLPATYPRGPLGFTPGL